MVRKDRLIACAVSQSANHGSYAPHDGFVDESNPEPYDLLDRLSRYRQIKITVIGRKSGKTISNPVWFVAEGDTLYLLPVTRLRRPMVQERSQEPGDSDLCAWLRGRTASETDQQIQFCKICD
jgi:hypothetical protein